MLQQLVVVLAVLAAALYVTWALVPARLRFAALTRLDAALGPGTGLLRERIVAPLLRRALPSGGCASCGSGDAPAASAAHGQRRPFPSNTDPLPPAPPRTAQPLTAPPRSARPQP